MYIAIGKDAELFIVHYILLTATCPALPAPDNGMIECISGIPTPAPEPTPSPTEDSRDLRSADTADIMIDSITGDTCIFTCNEGYRLIGSENKTCGDDGIWSDTDATCTVPSSMISKLMG